MRPHEILPAAQEELEELLLRFAEVDARLTLEFECRYKEARSLICDNPILFHERRFTVRRVNLRPQFGEYYIAFLLWREKIVILAIAHAKRRPFYFRRRIGDARRMV